MNENYGEMKKLLIVVPFLLLLIGCAANVDVASLSQEARYKYAMDFFADEEYEMAIKELESFLLQYPGSELSDDAQFHLGQAHFKKKEYLLGAYEFSKLIKNMPASQYLGESQYMLASCYEKLSPPYPLDQKYTKKAIDEFQAFIDFFPADPKVAQADSSIKVLFIKLAEKEINSAKIYERMEYFTAAINTYGKVAESYHDTQFAPEALYKKINLLIQKNRPAEARQDIEVFLNRYPKDNRVGDIEKLLKELDTAPVVSTEK